MALIDSARNSISDCRRRYGIGCFAAHVLLSPIPDRRSGGPHLGIDVIRRILTGQTVTAVIGGAFSLASLGVMLIYDLSLTVFAVGYALVTGALLFCRRARPERLQRNHNRAGIVRAC
jgi:hypothetical protein